MDTASPMIFPNCPSYLTKKIKVRKSSSKRNPLAKLNSQIVTESHNSITDFVINVDTAKETQNAKSLFDTLMKMIMSLELVSMHL